MAEKKGAVKKTSVTIAGITADTLALLNDKVTKSGLSRGEFLKQMLENVVIQKADNDRENELIADIEKITEGYNSLLHEKELLVKENEFLSKRYDICKKYFFIPDKLGVILRALIEMGEVKSFAEGIDYILEPYWKQNKLVADQNDVENYLAWKQKILDDGCNQ